MSEFLGGRVRVLTGDITEMAVDAIVNAANWSLLGGAGVDGAIHSAGGPAILSECRKLRRTRYPKGLAAGDAVITTGGDLPARFVIHTVGPIWGTDADADQLLASCYRKSIALASAHGLKSIAFPAISTGAYGYPRESAAAVVSRSIAAALAEPGCKVEEVSLVFFFDGDRQAFVEHQRF